MCVCISFWIVCVCVCVMQALLFGSLWFEWLVIIGCFLLLSFSTCGVSTWLLRFLYSIPRSVFMLGGLCFTNISLLLFQWGIRVCVFCGYILCFSGRFCHVVIMIIIMGNLKSADRLNTLYNLRKACSVQILMLVAKCTNIIMHTHTRRFACTYTNTMSIKNR